MTKTSGKHLHLSLQQRKKAGRLKTTGFLTNLSPPPLASGWSQDLDPPGETLVGRALTIKRQPVRRKPRLSKKLVSLLHEAALNIRQRRNKLTHARTPSRGLSQNQNARQVKPSLPRTTISQPRRSCDSRTAVAAPRAMSGTS